MSKRKPNNILRFMAGSCVACGHGTDTAIGVRGEAEWHVAFLMQLGIPLNQAAAMQTMVMGCDPGMVPIGLYNTAVRVCAECFAQSTFHPYVKPVLYAEGVEIPTIMSANS